MTRSRSARALLTGACVLAAGALVALQWPKLRAQDVRAREQAYRLNNIGVARLEQYDYKAAADTFRQALANPGAPMFARLNLALALYYDNQLDDAEREARAAAAAQPDAPQPAYVLGLIARAAGRSSDAVERFRRVLAIDSADVGAKIQLGQVLTADRQFADAIALLEQAAKAEPFNATAAYGLAMALTRAGRADDGRSAMARFQELRDNPAAITYSNTYLAQGRYAEAIVSTGLESELVDNSVPDVAFVDATDAMLAGGDTSFDQAHVAALHAARAPVPSAVTLADIDNDGDLDLLIVTDRGVDVRRNEGGRFAAPVRIPIAGTLPIGAAAGDYDNDGHPDLFVAALPASRLFHQENGGSFRDVTSTAALPGAPDTPNRGVTAAAWVDVDHDGDLDIVAGTLGGGLHLIRNNGNGRFSDASSESRLGRPEKSPAELVNVVGLVPTDFDNDRDVDLLVVASNAVPRLMSNLRDGTFGDVASAVAMPPAAEYSSVAAADINKDGATDFFLGRVGFAGLFVTSTRSGRFATTVAPDVTKGAVRAQFLDYDDDGLLDLFVIGDSGPRLLRRVGDGWADVSARALKDVATSAEDGPVAFAVGDLDGDGDADVVVRLRSNRTRVWRNDGGSRRSSMKVSLTARVSNRSSLGAKVELAAGSLRQKLETSSTTPAVAPADLIFGLGSRERADVVRILWPAGILQSEVDVPSPVSGATVAKMAITELDRKPSSCPYLFTWNGSRFEFITDFMGGGEMGAWLGPGERSVPDPVEYVRIPRGALVPRDGRLELRVTNELEEALFVDRLQIVAVDHPAGVDVYPASGLRSPAYRRPFALSTVQGPRPPRRATDDRGRDVLAEISAVDRRAADDFALESIQGYAREHSLTLDLGPAPRDARLQLILTGWTDYAFSSDNVAAHQAGLAFVPPSLQMRDERGWWTTVVPEIGLPTGRPQTIVLDLTEQARRYTTGKAIEVRIVSTARVYWDQVLVDTSLPAAVQSTELTAIEATLRWRGFSAEITSKGAALPTYDYQRVTADAPWKTMPGRYTRFGDVRPLLQASDDQFVISAPGDEIALAFDAAALPLLPAGWERTFLLHADGFSKEMNLHSASPDRLEPLPFHGMTRYPYAPPERYPRTPAHDRYRSTYNSRIVGGPLPTLERALLR